MFYRYEIRQLSNKKVLYLFMSSTEEEADEFSNNNVATIENKVENFIEKNNINYEEGPVYIISNGIIIKSIDIKNKKISIEELIEKDIYSNNKFIVKVKLNDNSINVMTLKDYLTSAILTNISYDHSVETLKCLAILYRTYAYKQMAQDGFIKQNDEFIKYKSISYYKLLWFHDFEVITNHIEQAINETDNIFMTYDGLFIKPFVHDTNNGTTDKLPGEGYLQKISSLWDLESENYLTITKYSIDELATLLDIDRKNIFGIKITDITDGGCINQIKVGYKIYSGNDFAEKLHLPSKDMTIIVNENEITFINRGKGHNLGLSISGADILTKNSCTYLQILNYYFPTCKIKKYI